MFRLIVHVLVLGLVAYLYYSHDHLLEAGKYNPFAVVWIQCEVLGLILQGPYYLIETWYLADRAKSMDSKMQELGDKGEPKLKD